MSRRRRRWLVPAVVSATGALMLGPTLLPGYTLSYDMVFVPRQTLLPVSLGLGEVLPRAVPQDAVLSVLTSVLPGQVWQHLALLFIVIGSGLGVAALLRTQQVWQQCMGALLYSWSAYVAERLVMGSWPLLVAYAALPWALRAALGVRRRRPGAAETVVLLVALASLAPSGALLVLLVTVPIIVTAREVPRARRALVLLGMLALQAPWVVAGLTSPARSLADSNGSVFAMSSEGPWGPLVTALGTGGVWNTDAVLATRTAGLGVIGTAVVLALAIVGATRLSPVVGRSGALTVLVSAVAGLVIAVGQAVAPNLIATTFSSNAPLSILRDGQRWLAPLALLLALCAPLGAGRLVQGISDRMVKRVLAGALVALPLIVMPDAAWGVGGRLSAVSYPPEWQVMRTAVEDSAVPGDVVVLPWSTFRQFEWNGQRTVLDPAPRWLTRPSVVDDSLIVGRPDGSIVTVGGESARGSAVRTALESGHPLEPVLRAIGVGLVLIEGPTPETLNEVLTGLQPVLTSGDLTLMEVPGGAQPPTPDPARVRAMWMAWAVAVGSLVIVATIRVSRLWAKSGAGRHHGDTVSPQSSGGTQS